MTRLPALRLTSLALGTILGLSACADVGSGAGDPGGDPGGETLTGSASDATPVPDCEVPASAETIPSDFWGMHLNSPLGPTFPDAPIGSVNLTTAATYWRSVEKTEGDYDFARLDAIAETAQERDARPLLVLGQTPAFHSQTPRSQTAHATMPDLEAWEAWVTAVVQRYGDQFDYQVWPEPNIRGNWEGTPQEMAELTVTAGRIIEAQAPDALVIAPATTLRLAGQRAWMEEFWASGVDGTPVADAVDVAAIDPYPLEDGTPEDGLDLVCQAQEILDEQGVDKPVWDVEINYGVPSGGGATDVQQYPEDQQAAYVARTYVLQAAAGLDRVYWLGWAQYPGMAIAMVEEDGTTPNRAAAAFEAVHGWLDGRARPTCTTSAGLYRCEVPADDSGPAMKILWQVEGTTTVLAPDGATELLSVDGSSEPVAEGDEVAVDGTPVAVVSN